MNPTKLEVLNQVNQLSQPSISDLVEEIGCSRTNIHNHLDDLKEKGLISVRETQHKHIREITDLGKERLLDELSDQGQVNRSGEQVDPYFVHFFAVRCDFDSKNFLPEDWRERFKEFEDLEVEEHKDFKRIQVTEKEWVYRLTGRSLRVQVRGELSGSDVEKLKDRAWSKAMEGLDHLEKLIGESIPRDQFEIQVETQHIGARRDNIAKAFIDHVDRNTIADPKKFRVVGDDEQIRIYCDASGPGGMLEAEAGNGGQVNGRMDTSEDDMRLLQDFTHDVVENPSSAKRLLETPERVDKIEENVSEIRETMQEFSRTVAEGMKQITTTVESEVGGSSQVQKQVSEMKTVQDDLREELVQVNDQIQKLVKVTEQSVSVQSSRSVSDKEIVEKLDEISGKLGSESSGESVVSPLADEVEITSKWEDRWGNIRGYSPDLDKQFKLIDSEDL